MKDDGVLLDTSGLFAVFHRDDRRHPAASQTWEDLLRSDAPLHMCNYTLVELAALLQRRLGIDAVDALGTHVLPWVHVLWTDETLHAQAVAGLLADCASFAAMRRLGLRRVFTFDQHFAEQGFAVLPSAG
jgi:predicted nucleic acid-binding protein